jgi:hypothetical protein
LKGGAVYDELLIYSFLKTPGPGPPNINLFN